VEARLRSNSEDDTKTEDDSERTGQTRFDDFE
jgi:hypothetical protein